MIITLVKLQREKYFITTKEINLKKQELAKGIKEFNVKSTFRIGNKWQGR